MIKERQEMHKHNSCADCTKDNRMQYITIVLYCIVLYCIVLYCIVLYCIVLYCIMRPYTDGPIGPLSYRHSSGVVRNPHSALAE